MFIVAMVAVAFVVTGTVTFDLTETFVLVGVLVIVNGTVHLLIDEKGAVINACAVSGNPLLWQPAELAAYQARYSPTTLSGIPVRTPGVITYNFRK